MPTAALPDEETVEATQPQALRRPGRPRLALVLVSIAVTLVVLLVLVVVMNRSADPAEPSGSPGAAKATRPRAAVPPPMRDVVPPIPVVSAEEKGPILQQGRIVSRDNGQSTRYGDQSIWAFADTLLRQPWGVLSNSGAATTDLRASDGIMLTAADLLGNAGRFPAEFMPRTAPELAFEKAHLKFIACAPGVQLFCNVSFGFWPGPVVSDPARHRVLIFYDKLCRGGAAGAPCSEKFGREMGTGVAALDMNTHRVTRLTPTNAPTVSSIEGVDPTMFFPPSTKYASAALVAGDDVYVYGDCETRCHLARAPLAQLTDRSLWRFYAGRDRAGAPIWSPDPSKAVNTVRAGAAGNTVFWDPALNGWLNVYMPWGSHMLKAQIGGSPYGPWSDPFTLLRTDPGGDGVNSTTYAAYAHPEYAERGGLVEYMSYYQNSTGDQRLVKVTFTP